MIALAIIALAACMFGPVLAGRVQKLIPDVPRPAVEPWGTNDPAEWRAELNAP